MSCRIIIGDAIEELVKLPAESVHCVVTSPPYWGLRDYGVSGQLGMERTVEEYVEKLVAVFREVKRVLRGDGTVWLNLGDTYAGGGNGGGGSFAEDGIRMCAAGLRGIANGESQIENGASQPGKNKAWRAGARLVGGGLKRKDLVGAPWRVALALQEDGWWLRMDNVWNKTNPMPESVRDRPVRGHEYVFLLSKRARYFYDFHAVKTVVTGTANARSKAAGQFPAEALRDGNRRRIANSESQIANGVNPKAKLAGVNSRVFQERDANHVRSGKNELSIDRRKVGFNARWKGRIKQNPSFSGAMSGLVAQRNLRSVWTMGTAPYRGAHFATFPPGLIENPILAGTSEHGCCGGCGKPWTRVVSKGAENREWQRLCGGDGNGKYNGRNTKDYQTHKAQPASTVKARILAGMREEKTVGWQAGCTCAAAVVPCVVLDPFGGSGTVGMVAGRLGRNSILIELNPEYLGLIEERVGHSRFQISDFKENQHSILT